MHLYSASILNIHWPNEGTIGNLVTGGHRWLNQALMRRKSYNQTVFELSACSDRELADMGIVRCDIRRVARSAAQSKTTE